MQAEKWQEMLQFLSKGELPQSVTNAKNFCVCKKNFVRKMKNFEYRDDTIYKICKSNIGDKIFFKCPHIDELPQILNTHHELLGHCGMNVSFQSIRQIYYWKNMSEDIKNYVRECHLCQMNSAKPPNPQKKLTPITPPDRPWKHIGVDIISDFSSVHLESDNFKHILVTVCYLSKYVVARPLIDKTTKSVIIALEDIYLEVGVPEIVQHDKGPEFTSKAFKEFTIKLQIDDRSTTAYHPQSNGLVEAHNKILGRKLEKMEVEIGKRWPCLLKSALFIINGTKKRSTKHSPFEIMFNRQPNLVGLLDHLYGDSNREKSEKDIIYHSFMTLNISRIECQDVSFSEQNHIKECISNIHYAHSLLCNEACTNIANEQTIYKLQFDKKVSDNRRVDIQEGNLFIYRNIGKDKKLPRTKKQLNYKGPCMAQRVTDSHVLANSDHRSEIKVPIHLAKRYFSRDENKPPIDQIRPINQSARPILKRKVSATKPCSKKRCNLIPPFTYGISREEILNQLIQIKASLFSAYKDGMYISSFHETMHKAWRKKGFPQTELFFLQFLKDIDPSAMKNEIYDLVFTWTSQLITHLEDDINSTDYSMKVIAPLAFLHLDQVFGLSYKCEKIDAVSEYAFLRQENAQILPITTEWQHEKCRQLNIEFIEPIEQHSSLVYQPLSKFQPWETCNIVGDGNCYFRCISKMITGSEKYHVKIREELCRYIVADGRIKLQGYFQMRNETAAKHIEESVMNLDAIYATEAEIMATSSMLSTDIYVGSLSWKEDSFLSTMSWQRFSASLENSNTTALYIRNFLEHYEPVIRMMNSTYATYNSDDFEKIVIE